MTVPNAHRFYIPYGTLPPDALSYVVRQADDELLGALLKGEFCYVLTSRQMGKSSLMVHTLERLREAGVTVALLDLTALGFNLDAEQWYNGLLDQLGRRLNLQSEVEDYTLEQEHLSPLQRWQKVLTDVVLRRIEGPVVIFVDEIDIVRSLPFSTDEFFAAIRSCYNARTDDAAYHRLTFCLLGVATPADLIKNPRLTPFNIGRRIHLDDFTAEEVGLLQHGLGRDAMTNRRLMQHILYWTGGHPCLTQRLCMAVAEDAAVQTPQDVDRCCDRLLLTSSSDHRDDNLEFVRQRLLSEESEDPAGLLLLYDRVLRGKRVLDDETILLIGQLKLSGVVKVEQGQIHVRNRIYGKMFDRSWVCHNLPGEEISRQKAAYRKGLLRSASAFGTVAMIMAGLTFIAFQKTREAKKSAIQAKQSAKMERLARNTAEDLLYAADMGEVQHAWDDDYVGHAVELLETYRKNPHIGWEWRYFQRISRGYFASLPERGEQGHTNLIFSVAFSPDGKTVASASFDNTIKLWNVASKREVATLRGHTGHVYSVAFSSNGKILASASGDRTVRLWDVISRQQIAKLRNGDTGAMCLAFSPHGNMLAVGSGDDPNGHRPGGCVIRLWDVDHHKIVRDMRGAQGSIDAVAFSPDCTTLASGSSDLRDPMVTLRNVAGRRPERSLQLDSQVQSIAFSPDGRFMAAGTGNGSIHLWDVKSERWVAIGRGHDYLVNCVAFSPDSKTLASASWDNTIRLWNVAAPKPNEELPTIEVLKGHTDMVNSVAFSPDGRTLVSGGNDRTLKLWSVGLVGTAAREEFSTLKGRCGEVPVLAFSPNSQRLIVVGLNTISSLWGIASGKENVLPEQNPVQSVAFSQDGKMIATGHNDGSIRLRDASSLREIKLLSTHARAVESLAFSHDGRILASDNGDGSCKLWDIASQPGSAILKGPLDSGSRTRCHAVAFSPDGSILATGSRDQLVRLWDVATLKVIAELRGHTNDVLSVAFSPDCKTLASSSWDRTIILWDTATHKPLGSLKGHVKGVNSVAFSSDGKTLASGSLDGTVKLWNVTTRRNVATFRTGLKTVNSVAFSQDGTWLAACGDEGTVKLWQAEPNPPGSLP